VVLLSVLPVYVGMVRKRCYAHAIQSAARPEP
jgi:hypothetical protein